MDGFTNLVAPVMMISLTRNDKDEKREIERKRLTRKIKKEESFEDEFAAVYVHNEDNAPSITYSRPRSRTVYR